MRVCIMTLGTRGDVQPYVALGKELVRNGHTVVICTGGSFKQFVEENGIEFKEATCDLMAIASTPEGAAIFLHPIRNIKLTLRHFKHVIAPAYRKTLDDFYNAAQNADMIVYHPKAFGAVDMALSLGIPCISMSPTPVVFPASEFANLVVTHKNLGPILNKLTYKINERAELSQIKGINDFRKKTLGLPERKAGIYSYTDGKNKIPIAYPVSPCLFPDVKSWDKQVFLSGFLFLETDESLPDELTEFLSQGEKPVVVTFGSTPLSRPEQFVRKLMAALKKTNERAVILTGNSRMVGNSDTMCFFSPPAPYSLLFQQAKGVIHHGGIGTTALALKAGIPQQIIPLTADQPFWAERLYKLGYALRPLRESTLSVDDLTASLHQMNDCEVQLRAKQLGPKIAAEEGNKRMVEYLENMNNLHLNRFDAASGGCEAF